MPSPLGGLDAGGWIDPYQLLLDQVSFLHSAGGQQMLRNIANDPALLGLSANVFLDFDEAVQPCVFAETSPLKGLYLNQAKLESPGLDGGAILDECSNFGIGAFSGANFLAFNSTVNYSNGGTARLPHVIAFRPGHQSITLQVSRGTGGTAGTIVIEAFGPSGSQDIVVFAPTTTWSQITLTGEDIAGFIVLGTPTWLLIDDVQAN